MQKIQMFGQKIILRTEISNNYREEKSNR